MRKKRDNAYASPQPAGNAGDVSQTSLYRYLLMLGDNSMILGHRLSELCGHGPNLETDIALTNISLDLFGEVRGYFQYAAQITGGEAGEDSVAFLRTEREYFNALLVEQPNDDFAHVIVRQFLFDSFHLPLLNRLANSNDITIAGIAGKSRKESAYHLRFSSEWVRRLGEGTQESNWRTQLAFNYMYPLVFELLDETAVENEMKNEGIGADLADVGKESLQKIGEVTEEAGLEKPDNRPLFAKGKSGIHSEHMGHILSELQYMQRTYPSMQW